jgi:hypothetical protein
MFWLEDFYWSGELDSDCIRRALEYCIDFRRFWLLLSYSPATDPDGWRLCAIQKLQHLHLKLILDKVRNAGCQASCRIRNISHTIGLPTTEFPTPQVNDRKTNPQLFRKLLIDKQLNIYIVDQKDLRSWQNRLEINVRGRYFEKHDPQAKGFNHDTNHNHEQTMTQDHK